MGFILDDYMFDTEFAEFSDFGGGFRDVGGSPGGGSVGSVSVGSGGIGGSVTVPSRTLDLFGLKLTLRGGTWQFGGGGTGARQIAVDLTNQFENGFRQNLQAYRAGAISRDQALANFDRLWQEYLNVLGAAGGEEKARAVADRQRGGRFDWFAAYRDPIGTGQSSYGGTGLPGSPFDIGGGGLIEWLRRNLLWVILLLVAIRAFRS
jgi:hypothetical protein